LKKRDMLKRKSAPPRGVLHVGRRDQPDPRLERFEPGEPLRPFVEHYWSVRWENQPPVVRETVPHPSVHLCLEPGRSELHGVYRRRFTRTIEGTGRVLGIKFLPGGFRPFTDESVSRLTDRVVPPSTVFGPAIDKLETEAAACAEACAAFERIDAFLTQRAPEPTSELFRVTEIAETIAADRRITRVEMLVDRFGTGLRQLQRLFREYVGVSPKWVIQRQRLIEAAECLRTGDATLDFSALALDLGYADQPHFIRDFKNLIGKTPADYLKSLGNGTADP
jgi:AraC-like DNA-binding protein